MAQKPGSDSRSSKNVLDFTVLNGKESICFSIEPKTCTCAVFKDLSNKYIIDSFFKLGMCAIVQSLEASEVFVEKALEKVLWVRENIPFRRLSAS